MDEKKIRNFLYFLIVIPLVPRKKGLFEKLSRIIKTVQMSTSARRIFITFKSLIEENLKFKSYMNKIFASVVLFTHVTFNALQFFFLSKIFRLQLKSKHMQLICSWINHVENVHSIVTSSFPSDLKDFTIQEKEIKV